MNNNSPLPFGERIQPILQELNDALWEREANCPNTPHDFPEKSLLAASKIFTAVLWDFLHKKQEANGTCMDDNLDEVKEAGTAIRNLVFKYTGKDTHQLMKQYLDEENT